MSNFSNAWFGEVINPDGKGPIVVALPYVGGSGRSLRGIHPHLPLDSVLVLVDLPGHGTRIQELCLRRAEDVVADLLDALAQIPTERLVLLGYSLGGWLAYEAAIRLYDDGRPPAGLVACGSRAPHTGLGPIVAAREVTDPEFLPEAVDAGLAAPEMLEIPELAEMFTEPLHADLEILRSYRYRPRRHPLPIPTCVIGFDADWIVPEPALRAWDEVCQSPHQLRSVGPHLALHETPDAFGAALSSGMVTMQLPNATSASGECNDC